MATTLYVFPDPKAARAFCEALQRQTCDCATLRRGRLVWTVPTDHIEARQAFQIARELGGEVS